MTNVCIAHIGSRVGSGRSEKVDKMDLVTLVKINGIREEGEV